MSTDAKWLRFVSNLSWVGSTVAVLATAQFLSNNQLAAKAKEAHRRADQPFRDLSFINLERWKRLEGNKNVYLLDIRNREDYAKGHVLGSRNIPLYELEMRALRELPKNSMIVVYCGYDEKCEEKYRMARQPTPCTDVASLLQDNFGFEEVSILAVEQDELLWSGTVFSSYEYELVHERINS